MNELVVVHLLDGPDLDSGLVHVDHEIGDALVLHRVPIGAGDKDRHVGMIGARVPHLLTVDDPAVAVSHGGGLQPGEVGAGARLAEELAPRVFTGERRPEHALLEFVRPVFVDRRRREAGARTER